MPNRGYTIHSRDRDGSPTPTGVSEFFELRRSSGWVLQTCTFVVRYSWWKALFACTNLINNINSQNVQMIFVLSFWYEIALFDDLLFFAGSIISGISHRMQFGKCGAYTACIYSIQIECFSNVFFFSLSLDILYCQCLMTKLSEQVIALIYFIQAQTFIQTYIHTCISGE